MLGELCQCCLMSLQFYVRIFIAAAVKFANKCRDLGYELIQFPRRLKLIAQKLSSLINISLHLAFPRNEG
jgi:hypothetical protein